ncbi:hypothetical protein HDU96_001674 [Phlyctochytrium bullatum]|nr:hypothetical protein HDU96_001674 [Phlyctochytrium bullatum]
MSTSADQSFSLSIHDADKDPTSYALSSPERNEPIDGIITVAGHQDTVSNGIRSDKSSAAAGGTGNNQDPFLSMGHKSATDMLKDPFFVEILGMDFDRFGKGNQGVDEMEASKQKESNRIPDYTSETPANNSASEKGLSQTAPPPFPQQGLSKASAAAQVAGPKDQLLGDTASLSFGTSLLLEAVAEATGFSFGEQSLSDLATHTGVAEQSRHIFTRSGTRIEDAGDRIEELSASPLIRGASGQYLQHQEDPATAEHRLTASNSIEGAGRETTSANLKPIEDFSEILKDIDTHPALPTVIEERPRHSNDNPMSLDDLGSLHDLPIVSEHQSSSAIPRISVTSPPLGIDTKTRGDMPSFRQVSIADAPSVSSKDVRPPLLLEDSSVSAEKFSGAIRTPRLKTVGARALSGPHASISSPIPETHNLSATSLSQQHRTQSGNFRPSSRSSNHNRQSSLAFSADASIDDVISQFAEMDLHSDEIAFREWAKKKREQKKRQRMHAPLATRSASPSSNFEVSQRSHITSPSLASPTTPSSRRGRHGSGPEATEGRSGRTSAMSVGAGDLTSEGSRRNAGTGRFPRASSVSLVQAPSSVSKPSLDELLELEQAKLAEFLARRQRSEAAFLAWVEKKETMAVEHEIKAREEARKARLAAQVAEKKKEEQHERAQQAIDEWKKRKEMEEAAEKAAQEAKVRRALKKELRKKEQGSKAFEEWKRRLAERPPSSFGPSDLDIYPHPSPWRNVVDDHQRVSSSAPRPKGGSNSKSGQGLPEYLSPPLLYREHSYYSNMAPDYVRKYRIWVAAGGQGLALGENNLAVSLIPPKRRAPQGKPQSASRAKEDGKRLSTSAKVKSLH